MSSVFVWPGWPGQTDRVKHCSKTFCSISTHDHYVFEISLTRLALTDRPGQTKVENVLLNIHTRPLCFLDLFDPAGLCRPPGSKICRKRFAQYQRATNMCSKDLWPGWPWHTNRVKYYSKMRWSKSPCNQHAFGTNLWPGWPWQTNRVKYVFENVLLNINT